MGFYWYNGFKDNISFKFQSQDMNYWAFKKDFLVKHWNCTSGWCQVFIIEEVRQKGIHFRGAAAHGAVLTVAAHEEIHKNQCRYKRCRPLCCYLKLSKKCTVTHQMLL